MLRRSCVARKISVSSCTITELPTAHLKSRTVTINLILSRTADETSYKLPFHFATPGCLHLKHFPHFIYGACEAVGAMFPKGHIPPRTVKVERICDVSPSELGPKKLMAVLKKYKQLNLSLQLSYSPPYIAAAATAVAPKQTAPRVPAGSGWYDTEGAEDAVDSLVDDVLANISYPPPPPSAAARRKVKAKAKAAAPRRAPARDIDTLVDMVTASMTVPSSGQRGAPRALKAMSTKKAARAQSHAGFDDLVDQLVGGPDAYFDNDAYEAPAARRRNDKKRKAGSGPRTKVHASDALINALVDQVEVGGVDGGDAAAAAVVPLRPKKKLATQSAISAAVDAFAGDDAWFTQTVKPSNSNHAFAVGQTFSV